MMVGPLEGSGVARERGGEQTYVLATDGSPAAAEAARWLGEVSRAHPEAKVLVLYVFDPVPYLLAHRTRPDPADPLADAPLDVAMQLEGQPILHLAQEALGLDSDRVRAEVRLGRPEIQILAAASQAGACAIVLGHRPETGWHHLVHTSLAERLERHAECAVVAVSQARVA
jgi:nucleotide-binding universal stress UspA family protein